MNKVLTVREYAALMRVSPSTVYDAVASGDLSVIRVGCAIRIPVPDELSTVPS